MPTGTRGEGITVLACSDTGWSRRLRVTRRAAIALAALPAVLTLAAAVSTTFALWTGAHLRRLGALELENRSLAARLTDQALRMNRLQSEMSSLRLLEQRVRSLSDLSQEVTDDGGAVQGEAPAPPPPS